MTPRHSMRSRRQTWLGPCAVLSALLAGCAHAQTAPASPPATPVPATTAPPAAAAPAPAAAAADTAAASPSSTPKDQQPMLKMPELRDLNLPIPRQVKAASALVGLGRQRLALVVGIGTVGTRQVVDSASRDAQAVAAALRDGGFVVMLREDLNGPDLRAALKEFHDRLQPGGLGFAYVTGLGAQLDGQNVLLPRDTRLDPTLPLAERQAELRKAGVPMSEVVDALMGPTDSPRLLVVDAAFRHPALEGLPSPGLAPIKVPPGMMALYGHGLGTLQEVAAVAPLPEPAPKDARQIAATPFARTLVTEMLKSRQRAPEVLRSTRRALADGGLSQNEPWLAGDTEPEELAEASLLDGIVPRTPEEIAREAASQAARALTRRHT